MNKLHIGYHKTGTTFLQTLVFPSVPNYCGRFYSNDNSCKFGRMKKKSPKDMGCRLIIDSFKKKDDIFISWEGFSGIPHNKLFKLLDDKWQVVVVTREFDSLFRSRRRHPSSHFFLNKKIQRGIKDKQVRDFYNPEKLRLGIENLTIISYEKLFDLDKPEMLKLSKFLKYDICKIMEQNIQTKINSSKLRPRIF